MAMLDLGTLGFTIGVDTSDLEKGLAGAKHDVDAFDKQLSNTGKRKLAPVVDATHITKLGEQLGRVDKSVSQLSSRRVAPGVDTRPVEKLAAELREADRAADSLSVPNGFTPALGGAADKARELAEALRQAAGGGGLAGQLGAIGGAVKGLLPHITAATVATTALTKGWSRLTAIEGATATLTGLGNSAAEVSAIMADANKAVKGTAFGLGDAAKTAASAVAAGVKPGEELEQVLTTVADTAAITGDNISDMGLIFNSVLSRGKLGGDDLMQLQSRGLPVLQLVADQLGVTAQEASKMATEGEISFEIFEEAMRNRVGGAAQSAGETVRGSMANVGAAIGRLGAMAEGPLFTLLPTGLNALTAGIDTVGKVAKPAFDVLGAGVEVAADGVTTLAEGWAQLPGPVKTVTVSIGAARVALTLLNTEMGKAAAGKITASLGAAKAGMMTFRTEVAMTSAQLRATNPNMSVFGANLRAVATNAGVATGAMGLLRGTASGLLGLVGGPAGLAVMGLGAAIGGLISVFQKHRQAAQEAEEAIDSWASALEESGGRVDDNIRQQALAAVQAEELGDVYKKTGHSMAEMAHAITDKRAYDQLIASLDEQIAKTNEVSRANAGAYESAWEQRKALEEQRDAVERLHGQFSEGVEKARETAMANRELTEMVKAGGDAADTARPKYAELDGVFAGVGEEAKSVDDAIKKLTERLNTLSEDPAVRLQGYVDQMHSALMDMGKTLSGGLPELNLDTGVWEQGTEQAIKLNAEFRDMASTMNQTAAAQYELNREMGLSHVEAAQAARDSVRGFTDSMREQLVAAGAAPEVIEKIIDTYAAVPDEVFTQLEVGGLDTADELSRKVQFTLAQISDDATVLKVDSSALELTADEAKKLGFELVELEDGRNIELHAETETAQAALDELIGRADKISLGAAFEVRANTGNAAVALNQFEGIMAFYDDNPVNLGVIVDSDKARRELDRLNVEYTAMDGYIHIRENTDEVRTELAKVGVEVATLPEGYITIRDNSGMVEEALTRVGVATTKLPDGELLVTSNVEEVQAELEKLNRWGEAFGEQKVLEFLADTTEFDMSAEEVAERLNELDRSGAEPVTGMDIQEYLDKDGDVRQALLDLAAERAIPIADLDPKAFNVKRDEVTKDLNKIDNTTSTAKVEADDRSARSTIANFFTWMGNLFRRPQTVNVNARNGGGSSGYHYGGLVGYANGGYIPNIPGVSDSQRDPIVAVNNAGVPFARVEPREYVVNRSATAKNLPLLEAINNGRLTMGDLPGYATGGVIQAMTNIVKAKYPGMTMTSGYRAGDNGYHGQGLAADFSNGSGNTPEMLALARDIASSFPNSNELIYDAPGWSGNIKNGRNVGAFGDFYTMGQAGPHHHHVHWAMETPPSGGLTGGTMSGMSLTTPMKGSEANLTVNAVKAGRAVTQKFPGILSIGGWRQDPYPDHPSGRALDIMIGSDMELGDRIKDYLFSGPFNMEYALWRQAQWNSAAAGSPMADRGSPTQNHMDHVHAYFKPSAFATGEETYEIPGVTDMGVAGGGRRVDTFSVHYGQADEIARNVKMNAHKLEAMARYNAGVYDKGGVLKHGQIAINQSGHDEYVIPPALTDTMVRYFPAYAEALPGVTGAINNFTTVGEKIVNTGFSKAGVEEVGWQQVQAAKTGLRNLPEDTSGFHRWALYANRVAGEALMGAATMTNMQWAEAGQKLGLTFIGEYVTGVLQAQDDLEMSYVAQVDAADALVEAQDNVTKAQAQLNEVMAANPELSTQKARQLEDAERKLAEARTGGDAKKITDAERNLNRVREDAAAELEKSGAKDAEAVLQAREAVVQAEADLTTAEGVVKASAAATGQAQIAMAVEVAATVIKLGKAVYEMVAEIVQFERAARISTAEAHAQAMGNMRDLTLATEKQRNVVANLVADMVKMRVQVLDSSWQVRQAQDSVWTAHLEGLVGIRKAEAALQAERDKLNGKQRYNFVGLDIEYDKLIGNVYAGLAGLDGVQSELLDMSLAGMAARINGELETSRAYGEAMAARLQATKNLTDEETMLVADVFAGKFAGYNDETASIEERRQFAEAYYAMQKAGMEQVMEQGLKSSAELQALEALRFAAQWQREKNIFTAQLTALNATYAQQDAVIKLARLGRDLNDEIDAYNTLQSGTMGMQSDVAVILAEIARIEAESAKARADMQSAEARWGAAFDWNGDGKTLFFNNKGSQKMQAARATLTANETLLAELNKRLENVGGQRIELSAEDRHKLMIAGRLMADGENERAQGLIRSTALGKAKDVETLRGIDKTLKEIKDERRSLEDTIIDTQRERELALQRLPLDMQRYWAEGMENAYRSDAEGFREADKQARLAWQALADWQREYANNSLDVSANRSANGMMMGLNVANKQGAARNQTLLRVDLTPGALMYADDVAAAFKQLETQMDGVKIEVRELQRATTPGPKQVQLVRAGITR